MKKFLLSAFALAVVFSASAFNLATTAKSAQLGAPMNAKQAPKELIVKMAEKAIATKASTIKLNNPVTKASDLEGGYNWTYEMASSEAEDPTTVTGTEYTDPVVIYGADDEAGTVKIAGMFDGIVSATVDASLETYDYVTFTLGEEEAAYARVTIGNKTVELKCKISGEFYYEGDDTYEAGWYITDVMGFIVEDEIIFSTNVWISREISSIITEGDYSQYIGYTLTPIWKPGSYMEVNNASNGVMEYAYNSFDWAAAMEISESEDYVITINNWAGLADNPVTIYMGYNNVWIADTVTLFTNSNGAYVLYGLDGDNIDYLQGTGTATTLTTNTTWTGYDTETQYWLGERGISTITLVGSEFVWPVEETTPDVYILSTNGDQPMATNVGQKMELDSLTNLYTATVTFNGDESGYSYFKFSTKLLEAADDWDNLFPYMFGAVSNGDFLVTDEMIGIELSLKAQNDGGQAFKIPTGEYNLTLNYADMKLKIEKVASSKPGDANGDGNVDVNDVTTTINYILGKNPNPFVFDNANVNDDDDVNVNDVTMIINMILGII